LWWIDPDHSADLERQGLMLQTSPLDSPPRDLLPTLVYIPWLAFSPDGKMLAVVAGTGLRPDDDKHLALCDSVAGNCSAVEPPLGGSVMDPAWSPDGGRLAFVVAAREPQPAGAGTSEWNASWYASRQLWMADADGSGAAMVPAVPGGVSGLSWSLGGLRYSTTTAIETVAPDGSVRTTVVSGLSGGSGSGPDGIGKGPWSGSALWAK
jgi:dipeptidyl aminopeptidase/acylaminoacyl peptidase